MKPYLTYSIDGNQVCAVGPDFTDLQDSIAGFGYSLETAFCDYYDRCSIIPIEKLVQWELKFFQDRAKKHHNEETELFHGTNESLSKLKIR